jgi:hypothetical protein
VGTLVERTTLYVALVKLEDGKAETAAQAFAYILNRFDVQMRRSMTYDQGAEMARHQNLSQRTGLKVYFAHPHSPWERGINENTNGLLRQYLTKREDLIDTRRTNSTASLRCSTQDQESRSAGKLPLNSSYQKALSTSRSSGQLKSTTLHLELETTR